VIPYHFLENQQNNLVSEAPRSGWRRAPVGSTGRGGHRDQGRLSNGQWQPAAGATVEVASGDVWIQVDVGTMAATQLWQRHWVWHQAGAAEATVEVAPSVVTVALRCQRWWCNGRIR
jgi:hypothetical protein